MHAFKLIIALAGIAGAAGAIGEPMDNEGTAPGRPVFQADGTVRVPSFELPLSEYVSDEARAMQARRAAMPGGNP